jgi:hypothetical protein
MGAIKKIPVWIAAGEDRRTYRRSLLILRTQIDWQENTAANDSMHQVQPRYRRMAKGRGYRGKCSIRPGS